MPTKGLSYLHVYRPNHFFICTIFESRQKFGDFFRINKNKIMTTTTRHVIIQPDEAIPIPMTFVGITASIERRKIPESLANAKVSAR